jgi:hypothetical protein
MSDVWKMTVAYAVVLALGGCPSSGIPGNDRGPWASMTDACAKLADEQITQATGFAPQRHQDETTLFPSCRWDLTGEVHLGAYYPVSGYIKIDFGLAAMYDSHLGAPVPGLGDKAQSLLTSLQVVKGDLMFEITVDLTRHMDRQDTAMLMLAGDVAAHEG